MSYFRANAGSKSAFAEYELERQKQRPGLRPLLTMIRSSVCFPIQARSTLLALLRICYLTGSSIQLLFYRIPQDLFPVRLLHGTTCSPGASGISSVVQRFTRHAIDV